MAGILLFAFLCGLLNHYLFFGHALGISYPLFVGVFYAFIFWGLRGRIKRGIDFEFMLLIPIVLLSLTYFLFANLSLQLLNFIVIPVLIVMQTMRMGHVKRHLWHTIPYIADVLTQIIPQSLRHVPKPFRIASGLIYHRTENGKDKTVVKVAIGLLIALPLLYMVVTLLSSADTVFQQQVSGWTDFFQHINFGLVIFRVIWIVIISVYLFGYSWGLLYPHEAGHAVGQLGDWEPAPRKKISLDATIVLTVLAVINVVYMLFTVIQFSYFFAAGNGILPDGTNYAEYARKGFAELVVVTLINFSLLLCVLHGVRCENRRLGIALKVMLSFLVGSTVVMLISAYLRLSLYEEVYGYTYTRILVHAFMIFLGVLLMLSFIRVWYEARSSLLKQFLVVSLMAYVILNYTNIDVLIAKNNLARYEQSGKIDLSYLQGLSDDAIPELAYFNQGAVHKPAGMSAMLLGKRADLAREDQAWQAFNLAKERGMKALRNIP
ncbi:MAG: hypothetical protein JWM44_581 [Bacilli bacterium]|jgi:hypothetical protein|nr:hypothetical protein [Bacilli bacterium]